MTAQELKQQDIGKVLDKQTDTAIETRSAVWNGQVHLELSERTLTRTKRKVVENGKEQTLIEIDEDSDTTHVSYPTPAQIYTKEAEKAAEHRMEPDPGGKENDQQQVILLQVDLPSRQIEKPVADFTPPKEHLVPGIPAVEEEQETQELPETPVVERFDYTETGRILETELREEPDYDTEGQEYTEPVKMARRPGNPVDYPEPPRPKSEENSEYGPALEPPILEENQDQPSISSLVEQYDDPEEYWRLDSAILRAEYSDESQVSGRLVMDLEEMFPYRDSVTGSEAVESLWQEYGVEATVAEIPYFSENSGESWEEGWNSFDMVLQMDGMDMLSTEYLAGNLENLGNLEEPVRYSIDEDFETDQAIEFRESDEFSYHSGGYTASQRTREAWTERYGEEILELDPMERGIYAAFSEEESFRGAPLEPEEIGFMSESAIDMIKVD